MSLQSTTMDISQTEKKSYKRFYSTKCSSNGNSLKELMLQSDSLGKKKTTRKNLDLALCVYVSKANSKSSTGEAAPMFNTELDYKLQKQAYLLIYSLFLGYTFPSLPATISLFNLSYLASFLSFLNKWNFLKCSRAFRFVFPHGHV